MTQSRLNDLPLILIAITAAVAATIIGGCGGSETKTVSVRQLAHDRADDCDTQPSTSTAKTTTTTDTTPTRETQTTTPSTTRTATAPAFTETKTRAARAPKGWQPR